MVDKRKNKKTKEEIEKLNEWRKDKEKVALANKRMAKSKVLYHLKNLEKRNKLPPKSKPHIIIIE